MSNLILYIALFLFVSITTFVAMEIARRDERSKVRGPLPEFKYAEDIARQKR